MDDNFGYLYEEQRKPKKKLPFWLGLLIGFFGGSAVVTVLAVAAVFLLGGLADGGDVNYIPSDEEALDGSGKVDLEMLTGEDAE